MSLENDITQLKKLMEADKPVFKAPTAQQIDNRMLAKERSIRARRAKDTEVDRRLEMEPEDVDPVLAMWFEDWSNSKELYKLDEFNPKNRNEYIFSPFIRDVEGAYHINLRDLETKHLDPFNEDTRDENGFCQEAEDILVKAGLYVYNSDTRFEVYTKEDMETVPYEDMDESRINDTEASRIEEAQRIFKAASPEQIAKRHPMTAINPGEVWYEVYADYGEDIGTETVETKYGTAQEALDAKARYEFERPGQVYGVDKWVMHVDGHADCLGEVTDQNESVNEKDIFKAASPENIKARGSRPKKNPPPGGFEFPFLEYIEDPDSEAKHWKFVGLGGYIDMESSEIWFDIWKKEVLMSTPSP